MLWLDQCAEVFAEARQRNHMTQQEVSEIASVSRALVVNFEQKKCGDIGFNKVSKLLESVGVSLRPTQTGTILQLGEGDPYKGPSF